MRPARIFVIAAAAVAAAPSAALPADAGAASLESRVERLIRQGGKQASGIVVDTRGRTLAAVAPDRRQTLGSLTKLFTTSAALLELRAPATSLLRTAEIDADGTLPGDLVLRGGGDALLGERELTSLAAAAHRAGIRRLTGGVLGDGTVFDSAIGGPATAGRFDPEMEGSLGGLTYQRGRRAPGGPVLDTPVLGAASRFDDLLEARGITIPSAPRVGPSPPGAAPVAGVRRSVARAILPVNRDSDDFAAEPLSKALGAQVTRRSGTSAAGAAAVAAVTRRRLGVRPVLRDGAGLVAGSRASARDVARVLRRMDRRSAFRASLARAGRSGTLRTRARGTGCRGKTGTLPSRRLTALAVVCGRRVAVVIMPGLRASRGRVLQDRVARVVSGR